MLGFSSVVGVETGVGTKAVLGLILALTFFGLVLLKLDLAESPRSVLPVEDVYRYF